MTVEEKRRKLREYCNSFGTGCEGCVLKNEPRARFGGCHAKASKEEIEKHYEMVFNPDTHPVNTCVSCGAEILEGSQVCPDCEVKQVVKLPRYSGPTIPMPEVKPPKAETDPIKPSYYNDTRFSPFDVIDDWGLNFYLGNAVKYIKRAGKKANNSRLQDLKKVREYIDHEIAMEEVSG